MLGIVDFVRAGWLGNPETAFLSLLMIASPYRARGFGAEVVRLLEAEIIRSGQVRIIQSGVQVNNPNAIQFWLRMGYKIVSGAEDHPDGTTVFRLEKIIRRT
jgi:ribosomal protein S18 acetylase RimI-like enzyme